MFWETLYWNENKLINFNNYINSLALSQILEVNGVNLEGATHEQAVAALKGVDRVAVMKVRFHSQGKK